VTADKYKTYLRRFDAQKAENKSDEIQRAKDGKQMKV